MTVGIGRAIGPAQAIVVGVRDKALGAGIGDTVAIGVAGVNGAVLVHVNGLDGVGLQIWPIRPRAQVP